MSETIDILLVDDDLRNLDALEAILARDGYGLLRAQSAEAALKLLLHHEVAAIMLDIRMPGTSGFVLAKMIKASRRYQQIPILFLTAHLTGDNDVLAGYGAGAVDYLTKPLNPEIVRHKVAVFASLYRKTRALAQLNETLEQRVRERTAELERSEAALRATDQKKDEFIAILAHELRNPLAPVRFGLEILGRQQAQTPLATRTIATMNRQLDHMTRVINDLLDMSRLGRTEIELQRERVDLSEVVEGSIETARPFVDQKGHELSFHSTPGVCVDGDATRLAQIVGNLLHNAAKFTPDGGRIAVEVASQGGDAIVRVRDSGPGIPHDQIERAFEMFARIDARRQAEQGLGIGLALGLRLAKLHGGSLSAAANHPHPGATFTLRLPLDAAARPTTPAPSHGPATAASRPLEIVVIEDSQDVADTLSTVLESMGHRVSIASDGPSGIALVAEKLPHAVLCDLGIPELDGVEVCRRIRRLPLASQPRMVALTGWGQEEDRQRTKEAGFDDHLVKPVAPEQLQRTLSCVGDEPTVA